MSLADKDTGVVDGLGVGRDGEATGALDVHEERSRGGDESLELVLLGLAVFKGQLCPSSKAWKGRNRTRPGWG